MTNECVMHTVEPGQRPARLIRSVNTAQVNLTTKTHTHTHLMYLGEEAGSCLDLAPGRREGTRGMKVRVQGGDGEL